MIADIKMKAGYSVFYSEFSKGDNLIVVENVEIRNLVKMVWFHTCSIKFPKEAIGVWKIKQLKTE